MVLSTLYTKCDLTWWNTFKVFSNYQQLKFILIKRGYMVSHNRKHFYSQIINFTLLYPCFFGTGVSHGLTMIMRWPSYKSKPKNQTILYAHNHMYSHNPATEWGGERSNFLRVFHTIELKEERKRLRNGFQQSPLKNKWWKLYEGFIFHI